MTQTQPMQPKEIIALEALEQYTERLMSCPSVVALGIGKEERNDAVGYVVSVYVDDEEPVPDRLSLGRCIPPRLALCLPNGPRRVEWVPTRIEAIGAIELE